ncbi:hypothetical protein BJY52DRAFT_1214772 [Lactarius psammicola]|nr:hypothetical protein BJY52DRAFT_1214772 [Lactarius psammicola]
MTRKSSWPSWPFLLFFSHVLTQTTVKSTLFMFLKSSEVDEFVDEWTSEPLGSPFTPKKQIHITSVPVVCGANGPRLKLANTGKQVLNLASFNFTGLAGNEIIKVRAIETLREYDVDSCDPPGFYGTIDVHIGLERDIAAFLSTEASIIYSQVADRGTNFAIQKGLQTSCSTSRRRPPERVGSTETYVTQATQIDMLVASRIDGTTFVFSAAVPTLLAVSASEGINILRNMPSILSTLQENENLRQDIVDEALAQGVWITRARRLHGRELVEARPSIHLAVTAGLSRKECEHAAGVIKAAIVKVLAKRK